MKRLSCSRKVFIRTYFQFKRIKIASNLPNNWFSRDISFQQEKSLIKRICIYTRFSIDPRIIISSPAFYVQNIYAGLVSFTWAHDLFIAAAKQEEFYSNQLYESQSNPPLPSSPRCSISERRVIRVLHIVKTIFERNFPHRSFERVDFQGKKKKISKKFSLFNNITRKKLFVKVI